MLREVVNAVATTVLVSEWVARRDDDDDAAPPRSRRLWVGAGLALLVVNALAELLPAVDPSRLLGSPAVAAFVEAALLTAAAAGLATRRRAPATARAAALMFVVAFCACYGFGGGVAAPHAPRALVAAAAFVLTLYLDVRRGYDVPAKTFFAELARCALLVAPLRVAGAATEGSRFPSRGDARDGDAAGDPTRRWIAGGVPVAGVAARRKS